MKVIVTGFEAFLSHQENPTEAILKKLPKALHNNEIITCLLPVEFDHSFTRLKQLVEIEKPDVVIMLGLAGGRTSISPERVAINIDHSKSPDNNGITKHHSIINKSGKNAYFSRLPLEDIVMRLTELGIQTAISNSAGTYVCNHVFYHMMDYIAQTNNSMKAGFIHIPYMTEQERKLGEFSLDLTVLVQAIKEVIAVCTK